MKKQDTNMETVKGKTVALALATLLMLALTVLILLAQTNAQL